MLLSLHAARTWRTPRPWRSWAVSSGTSSTTTSSNSTSSIDIYTFWRHVHSVAPHSLCGATFTLWRHIHSVAPGSLCGAHSLSGTTFTFWSASVFNDCLWLVHVFHCILSRRHFSSLCYFNCTLTDRYSVRCTPSLKWRHFAPCLFLTDVTFPVPSVWLI